MISQAIVYQKPRVLRSLHMISVWRASVYRVICLGAILASAARPENTLIVGKPEAVAEGLEGGEGPVWSRQGYLLFSDTAVRKIYKYAPGQAKAVYREESEGANGNTFDRQGRLYSCEY